MSRVMDGNVHKILPERKHWSAIGLPVVFPFSRVSLEKEAEESFLDRINQKIIEQGVLRALTVALG